MPTLSRREPLTALSTALLRVLAVGLLLGAATTAATAEDRSRLRAHKLSWPEVQALPDGQQVVQSELARQRIFQARSRYVHNLLGPQQISSRSRQWLAARGLGPARLADPLAAVDLAATDTLRVILVRISFETNRRPDLVTMAPDGDFFLDPHDPDDPLPIDPTPHDKAFFESHLQGLAEYYRFQSGGRLVIESRVLPDGDTDSYKLLDVANYGPGEDGFWTLAGLESLVRDMITAADEGTQEDGSVDLSDYADDRELTYIIFAHAGSDWQSDINQDSPNDIPTFFVTLGEAQPLLGGGELSECSVIPETINQDGYRGSIAAALYHEFGHALGLPDVYDAWTGLTACGVWDLMDSGTNLAATLGYRDRQTGQIVAEAVTGILPPSLSVWCKWFLGWVETDLITGGEETVFELPAVGVLREQYDLHSTLPGYTFTPDAPQALKGGASPREFFLVENRWVPLAVEGTPYDSYVEDPDNPENDYGGLYFKTDPATGVVLYLAGDRAGVEGLNTGYYDYFLPDGGLLVWHVNMDRIEAGLATNTINRFGDGLKLVEADGIQDIGVLDAYVLGWFGSARDPFAPWNSAGYTELFTQGPGLPTSRAFDRSWTGLRLWGIDDAAQAHGAVMSLRATVEPLQVGWPAVLPSVAGADGPVPLRLLVDSLTPLRGSGERLLVASVAVAADTTDVLVFLHDVQGEPAYPASGDLPGGAILQLDDLPAAPPAVLPLTDGSHVLLIGSVDGSIQAVQARDDAPHPLWSEELPDSLLAGPQPVPLASGEWLVLAIDGAGDGHLFDEAGDPVGEPLSLLGGVPAPLLAEPRVIALADGPAILLVLDDGWRLQPVTAAGFDSQHIGWLGRLQQPAEVAILPVADEHRLLVFGPEGLQGSWLISAAGDHTLAPWPDAGVPLVCAPAVADLDGDGRHDLIAATATRVFAWHDDGVGHSGYPAALASLFPLPETTRVAGPLVVADLDGGPGNELAFATDRGHLIILGRDARALPGTPYRFGEPGQAGLALVPHATGRASLAIATAGGLVGEPLDRRLTSGRIALYDDRPLPAAGPATATWQGPGGGPTRTGPVGVPRVVAGESAAAQGQDGVVFYPNPVEGRHLTVRFYSASDRPAELVIYNLQGEVVRKQRLDAESGRINEHTLELDVASGLYVARLSCERTAGRFSDQVKTIAVVR